MQKWVYSMFFSEIVNFRVPWSDWPHPFLTMAAQKPFDKFSIFVNLYQYEKNQFIPSVHSSDTVNFRVQRPDWSRTFLTISNQNNINELLFYANLHQHAQKWGCFINLFWTKCCFKNPAIWLAESISVDIRNKIFLNMGFVQEHTK